MRDWESTFKSWAQGPGKTEQDRCDNAIRAISDAISASDKLKSRGVNVFLQGSYRNRVNVRQDSDVDVGIVCTKTFFPYYPKGTDKSTFGNSDSDYTFKQFKDEVEEALVDKFGRAAVTRGNKAFDIKANSYRVESDLAAFFECRHYRTDGSHNKGVALKPDDGGGLIKNYPEQHYENGVDKNTNCSRRYKRLVRILKKLSIEMADNGVQEAEGIPGFLCECLVWNVPNSQFNTESFSNDLRNCLLYLYNGLEDDGSNAWNEVSEQKKLFQSSQKWKKQQARDFIVAAWHYVGFE
ncbi:MAG: nucleotidyltransferase [Candidatus Thiodiazotropha sp. (ex Lucina pensylvanica)]|nr:nucleotidyltransferase [Candidatus Thiodiazotropha sp. (ex Lucina pensylvanica)]